MSFVDRKPTYPNRFLIKTESGESFYATLARADEPIVAGTPLNATTLNELMPRSEMAVYAASVE